MMATVTKMETSRHASAQRATQGRSAKALAADAPPEQRMSPNAPRTAKGIAKSIMYLTKMPAAKPAYMTGSLTLHDRREFILTPHVC